MVDLNREFSLKGLGISNSAETGELPRHRWYFVKEGFSPRFVEHALRIDDVKSGELLLDPFSGGGTVPLTAARSGLNTVAFEVNPFLRFLSAAKLSTVGHDELLEASAGIVSAMNHPVPSPLEGYSTFTKGNRWGRWLFPLSVIRTFEAGRRALLKVGDKGPRALLKLALIGAAMDCCNATRDGKCLRFPNGWNRRQVTAVRMRKCFETRVCEMAEDLQADPLAEASARVVEGDARVKLADLRTEFRMCVTSPPYLNSFDYSDVYRPELFLGEFVASTNDLMRIRLKTMRSHVQASWKMPEKDEFGLLYRKCITQLRAQGHLLWDKRLAHMVQAYFEDMENVLRSLRSRVKKNGSLWLVVSTSAYAGVEVPVDLIVAEIGQRVGWFLREVGVLRYLRSSSQHVGSVEGEDSGRVPLRESAVIFDAVRT